MAVVRLCVRKTGPATAVVKLCAIIGSGDGGQDVHGIIESSYDMRENIWVPWWRWARSAWKLGSGDGRRQDMCESTCLAKAMVKMRVNNTKSGDVGGQEVHENFEPDVRGSQDVRDQPRVWRWRRSGCGNIGFCDGGEQALRKTKQKQVQR